MNSIRDLTQRLGGLQESLVSACRWLTDIAQVQTDELTIEENRMGHCVEGSWRGAFRGEYSLAERKWWFFCPVWHGGQAVKALVLAWQLTAHRRYLDSAKLGAEFIISNQVDNILKIKYNN